VKINTLRFAGLPRDALTIRQPAEEGKFCATGRDSRPPQPRNGLIARSSCSEE